MVLASPVNDRRGRMLIPAGKELDEKLLKALRMWGIATVDIDGVEDSAADPFSELPEEAIAAAKAKVEPLFARNPDPHPLVAALIQRAVLRHATRPSQEAAQAQEVPAHAG